MIDRRYPPHRYNIYPFHFSDGDNLTSDNERCVQLVQELIKRCNLFGYTEVNQYGRHSTLMSAYRHIKDPKFLHFIIREKGQVYEALKHFFSNGEEEAPAGWSKPKKFGRAEMRPAFSAPASLLGTTPDAPISVEATRSPVIRPRRMASIGKIPSVPVREDPGLSWRQPWKRFGFHRVGSGFSRSPVPFNSAVMKSSFLRSVPDDQQQRNDNQRKDGSIEPNRQHGIDPHAFEPLSLILIFRLFFRFRKITGDDHCGHSDQHRPSPGRHRTFFEIEQGNDEVG